MTTPETGATGGLPGEHAAAQNSDLGDDARDETVAAGDVALPEVPSRATARVPDPGRVRHG